MFIVDTKRTPIGKFLGALSNLSAPELSKPLFYYFLNKYPFLKHETDEVIIGNVLSSGIGLNPARIASFKSGISETVPAYTINHACASGMNAVIQGFRLIKTGDADIILAGGMESMSQAPYLVKRIRQDAKFRSNALIDSIQKDALCCSISNQMMGETAENIAKKYSIGREAQDKFALNSHKKAVKARREKVSSYEIIRMKELTNDEGPRDDTSLPKLAKLKPVFKIKGTVTAGNSSSINDGAALVLLSSEKALKKYNLRPVAEILDCSFVGLKPELMGMGPKYAIEKLLKRNFLKIADIDLFEINEAFAVQVLAVMRELKIDSRIVNIYGGAIALGHPLATSGVRIIGSLMTALKLTSGKLGIASLCVGGGQGAAMLIKNI